MLGDARVSLARQPDGLHDVMIFDAFNSDAVPVHLLTHEAFDLYLHKLSPRGVLAFHISSRYFDLRPVLSRLARDAQMVAYFGISTNVSAAEQIQGKEGSVWVIMARKPADIDAIAHDKRWMPADSNVKGAAWTDDYSDVLGSLVIAHDVIF
jgi:spermidine synthase